MDDALFFFQSCTLKNSDATELITPSANEPLADYRTGHQICPGCFGVDVTYFGVGENIAVVRNVATLELCQWHCQQVRKKLQGASYGPVHT